jgi:DNA (cytosine-5)-methyltransferase 1
VGSRRKGNGKVVQLPERSRGRAIELFAGVGGFRLALEAAGWQVVWSNQWEPSTRVQHASECYEERFGPEGHVCADISQVMDDAEAGRYELPDHDLLAGGFPCQDYSVARTLNQAAGLEGRKGVLWWDIRRALKRYEPRFVFLENVDRLLKSPASQRGRDFAIILWCLADLGYRVEWRVVNAADYGFPQRRRRVFIVGERTGERPSDPMAWLEREGPLAGALSVELAPGVASTLPGVPAITLDPDVIAVSDTFGRGAKVTPFENAGVMWDRKVWTRHVVPAYDGPRMTLGEILQDEGDVPESFFIPDEQIDAWRYLKGAKRELRHHRGSGAPYFYSEGAIPFPDPIDRPARTILTGEGGSGPSRFKHVVQTLSGRYRRLTPVELERLNGFPDGWTDTGMPDSRRAFMMGNALVVGVIERIAAQLGRTTLHAAEPGPSAVVPS